MSDKHVVEEAYNYGNTFVEVAVSHDVHDVRWDNFLEHSRLGQYRQSSLWAQAKQAEGWKPIRVTLWTNSALLGGFQILYRQTRFGNIAYLNKGPVLVSDDPDLLTITINQLQAISEQYRFLAVIVQLPDQSTFDESVLWRDGLLPNHLIGFSLASIVIPTAEPFELVEANMSRHLRKHIRQAKRRQVEVIEGNITNLNQFFALMQAACRRRNTVPNPPSEAALLEVWRAFYPTNRIRMTLALCDHEIVSGLISIGFGDRLSLWRKGWNGEHSSRHPNELLYYEAIQWATNNGYKVVDLEDFDQDLARDLLCKTVEEPPESADGIHRFKLNFGGYPVVFPATRIWIANPVLRLGYRCAFAMPWIANVISRFIK